MSKVKELDFDKNIKTTVVLLDGTVYEDCPAKNYFDNTYVAVSVGDKIRFIPVHQVKYIELYNED